MVKLDNPFVYPNSSKVVAVPSIYDFDSTSNVFSVIYSGDHGAVCPSIVGNPPPPFVA